MNPFCFTQKLGSRHTTDGELRPTCTSKRVYVQLKSGDSHLRLRKNDNSEVFDIPEEHYINYWQTQAYEVYLIIRDSNGTIRCMNLTTSLKKQAKHSKQVRFTGKPFTAESVFALRNSHIKGLLLGRRRSGP